jgi:hypothetical protein
MFKEAHTKKDKIWKAPTGRMRQRPLVLAREAMQETIQAFAAAGRGREIRQPDD